MILIIGLGNPEDQYSGTRHNIGFEIINQLAREKSFPDFKLQKKFQAEISEGTINGEKTILAKPQTFMNNSGQAVKALIDYYKTENLFVIHDDIDLPLGEIKISKGRGSAGHKGVESIIQHLKTKDFTRVRIGICPKDGKPEKVEDFVLEKFSTEEEKILKKNIENIFWEINKLTK
jgi:PTH1 family peptidyl-tRNA hydrolase